MLQSKSFFKKTRRGGVNHVVREHYLRDDIHSGSPLDAAVPPAEARLAADAARYLVVDANVALHQMDLLEHAAVADVVVPSTVLAEVKARSAAAHARLRALAAAPARRFFVFANEHCRETYVGAAAPGESANDRNDRAIRTAAAWYTARLAGRGAPVEVVLLSDDAASRRAAAAEGVRALSCAEYAAARAAEAPELADVVAAARSAEAAAAAPAAAAAGGARDAKRRRVYAEHLSAAELAAGIRAGRLHQGALRVSRFNSAEGFVGAEGAGEDILIRGRPALNRATDGDVVAVELLPEAEWAAPAAAMPGSGGAVEGEAAGEGEGEEEGTAEGARVAQVDPAEHYDADALGSGGPSAGKRPTGRVVGVIRRAWRPRGYCGSLAPPRAGAPPPADGALVSTLFIPVERRLPAVRMATRQAATLADKRIVVAIDAWEASATHPVGHYVRTLGPIGDRDVETEVRVGDLYTAKIMMNNDAATQPPLNHHSPLTSPRLRAAGHPCRARRRDRALLRRCPRLRPAPPLGRRRRRARRPRARGPPRPPGLLRRPARLPGHRRRAPRDAAPQRQPGSGRPHRGRDPLCAPRHRDRRRGGRARDDDVPGSAPP
jgi:exosome complex exonuclease DIS3/RRP44